MKFLRTLSNPFRRHPARQVITDGRPMTLDELLNPAESRSGEYSFGPPEVPVLTEPEDLPPHRLPFDYALCNRCDSAPSSGTQHWMNPDTHYERRVLNLMCLNGHRWTWSTDGG